MSHRRPAREGAAAIAGWVAAVSALVAAACAGPTAPSSNAPPTIVAIRSIGSRPDQPSGFADLAETITLSATVVDLETSADALEYHWEGPGTFAGSGASVQWRAPATLATTPAALTLTLTVAERYSWGRVLDGRRTSRTFAVRVHDSPREILDMGEGFLTRFSRSDVPTTDVLRDFSSTCDRGRGRRDEASDTDAARLKYLQDFSRFRIARLPPVTFNFGGACLAFGTRIRPADACSLFSVHWEFTYLVEEGDHRPGERGITDGIDHVTAVLENGDWRLCHSDFQ